MRETSRRSSRANPNVVYAVRTTWPTPRVPPTIRASAASGTSSAPAGSTAPRHGIWPTARGAPGGRGAVVAVLDTRRGLREPRALQARARPSALDLRAALRLRRPRPASQRRRTATAHTWPARSPRARTTASATAGSPTTRRSCRCACWTTYGAGDASAIARAHPVRRQHRADVINLSLEFDPSVRARADPGHRSRRSAAPAGGRSWSPPPATRPDASVAYPARASLGDRSRRPPPSSGCQADYSNSVRTSTSSAPGGGVDAANVDNAVRRDALRADPAPTVASTSRPSRRSVRKLRAPARLRGHVDGGPHVSRRSRRS